MGRTSISMREQEEAKIADPNDSFSIREEKMDPCLEAQQGIAKNG
jgi:hypothetical protein